MDEQIAMGGRGWVRYTAPDLRTPVFVRFDAVDGRLAIREVYVASDDVPLDAALVRRLPIGRIETWANSGQEREYITNQLRFPGPDLRRAIGYFATNFGKTAPLHWVRRMFLAQYTKSDEPQAPLLPLVEPHGEVSLAALPTMAELVLDVPPTRPFPDDFYLQVADLYRRLAGRVRNPVGMLADANHTEITRVYRWINIARSRGFLEKGQRGKAGG